MSLLSDYLPQCPIVLDASSLINLMATQECARILGALGQQPFIESRTLAELRRHPIPGKDHHAEIGQLLASGVLVEVQMTSSEYAIYLGLIQGPLDRRLDDGESAAISVSTRGYAAILDENKARRVVSSTHPALPFCSSTKLFLTAGVRGGWDLNAVRGHVLAARKSARMGFPREEAAFMNKLMSGVPDWR